MSEAQAKAQRERRAREREQAKEAANVAAGAEAEAAAESEEPANNNSEEPIVRRSANDWRLQGLEELRGRPEDDDEIEKQLSDFTEEPTEQEPEQPATPTAQPEQQPPAAQLEQPPAMVKVHVNGQEVEVSQAELEEYGGIRAYQRQKGLEHQIELSKENNKKTFEMMRQMAELMKAQQPVQPAKSLLDLAKEKAPVLQFGTTEDAATALVEFAQAATPKVDPQAIIGQAISAFSRKQAADEFCSQNPDIANNKYLSNLMVSIVHDRLSQSQPQDWRKFFAEVGVEIRNGVGVANPTQPAATTPANPNPTGIADRDARKASIVALPVAGSRMPQPEEPKPLTREDKLNQLRKARGQPT